MRNENDGEAAETGIRRSGSVSAMRASQSVIRSALYHIEAELPMIFRECGIPVVALQRQAVR